MFIGFHFTANCRYSWVGGRVGQTRPNWLGQAYCSHIGFIPSSPNSAFASPCFVAPARLSLRAVCNQLPEHVFQLMCSLSSSPSAIFLLGGSQKLWRHHPELAHSQGHQGPLPGFHRQDSEQSLLVRVYRNRSFIIATGHFPRKRGLGLRYQDGWWCVPQQGRSDTSWVASIRLRP